MLASLDITANNVTMRSFDDMIDVLNGNLILQRLIVDSNDLSEGLSERFLWLFKNNVNIERLSMADCKLADRGFSYLQAGLTHNKGLRSLNLSRNSLSDRGVVPIAAGLAQNSCLTHLNLS